MKIEYYLNEAVSTLSHEPEYMGKVTSKALNSGSISRKPSKITISDTQTNNSWDLPVEDIITFTAEEVSRE
jgi:hypothetical protein